MMITKTKVFCALVSLLLFSAWTMPVEAETASSIGVDADAIDAHITGQMPKHGIQGISLAMTSKTEIVYLQYS